MIVFTCRTCQVTVRVYLQCPVCGLCLACCEDNRDDRLDCHACGHLYPCGCYAPPYGSYGVDVEGQTNDTP